MDIFVSKQLKGFQAASRSRLGIVLFKIKDVDTQEITGLLTGDQLREQLKKYDFDIIDLKNQKTKENEE